MNKKGFTLVELLSVIAILAILVIIALPNVLQMFNNAKKSSFETEIKNVYTAAEEQWISDALTSSGTRVYSHCQDGTCNDKLSLNARDNLDYYIEFDSKGKVVKYYVTDGNYQYLYEGTGLKKNEIANVQFVPDVALINRFGITESGIKREVMEICIIENNYKVSNPTYVYVPLNATNEQAGYNFKTEWSWDYIRCIRKSCLDLTNVNACFNMSSYGVHVSSTIGPNTVLLPKEQGCYSIYDTKVPSISEYTCGTSTGVCLDGDTEVEVYDKKKKKKLKKKIKDVTYDDLLLAWDFDKGEYVWVKPFWIMTPFEIGRHLLLTFSDGSELKVISDHKIFDYELGRFVSSVNAKVGMKTINSNGQVIELVSKKEVAAPSLACNVITEKHMNIFANGILTSRGSNNLYEIKDMKFVKEERETIQRDELNPVDDEVYENLRLGERPINMYGSKEKTIKHLNELVDKLLSHMKR